MTLEILEGGEGGSSNAISNALPHTPFELMRQTKIRPLLELFNRIKTLSSTKCNIDESTIVVVGEQSHGKSSVLEAISGVDLPRGGSIKTRVPVVIQLRALSHAADSEYALIRVQSQNEETAKRITLEQVAEKIKEYTDKIAGNGKDVQDEPIELTVFRKEQLDLTLVDLPGITRVALEDQAGGDGKALETLLLDMCRRYMEPKESIILNVVSATADFSTSASLQFSREVDPEGCRTLLCVTKIDQHREKGLAEKILQAAQEMGLSYENVCAVRNRSQEENDASLPLGEARMLERKCLERATELTDIGELYGICLGVADMSRRLVEIIYSRLKETLPQTEKDIENMLEELQARLGLLGRTLEDETACHLEAQRLLRELSCCLEANDGSAKMPTAGFPIANDKGLDITVSNLTTFTKTDTLKTESTRLFGEEVCAHMSFKYSNGSPQLFLNLEINNPAISLVEVEVKSNWKSKTWNFEDTCREKVRKTSSLWIVAMGQENIKSVGSEKLNVVSHIALKSIEFNHVCLNSLDASFVSSMEDLYDNASLVSEGMFAHLKAESAFAKGVTTMPGSIDPGVPVRVLQRLQERLGTAVRDYVAAVIKLTSTRIFEAVDSIIDKEVYPNLNTLVGHVAKEAIAKHEKLSKEQTALILKLEHENVHTSNSYFMSTVQSLREHISKAKPGKDQSDRPDYLPKAWTAEKLASMSNEEQQIVDLQLQMFAYWKTMKKRLIDYVQLLTRSTVVADTLKTFNTMVNTALVRHHSAVILMAPDDKLARSRARLNKRINGLTAALDLLKSKTDF